MSRGCRKIVRHRVPKHVLLYKTCIIDNSNSVVLRRFLGSQKSLWLNLLCRDNEEKAIFCNPLHCTYFNMFATNKLTINVFLKLGKLCFSIKIDYLSCETKHFDQKECRKRRVTKKTVKVFVQCASEKAQGKCHQPMKN